MANGWPNWFSATRKRSGTGITATVSTSASQGFPLPPFTNSSLIFSSSSILMKSNNIWPDISSRFFMPHASIRCNFSMSVSLLHRVETPLSPSARGCLEIASMDVIMCQPTPSVRQEDQPKHKLRALAFKRNEILALTTWQTTCLSETRGRTCSAGDRFLLRTKVTNRFLSKLAMVTDFHRKDQISLIPGNVRFCCGRITLPSVSKTKHVCHHQANFPESE